MFQRPERASFISTAAQDAENIIWVGGFNALNGLLSFLPTAKEVEVFVENKQFQRPERASFISTGVNHGYYL